MNYDFSKYSILIADDEDSNFLLTKRYLSDTNAKTAWAQNGSQAIEMVSSAHFDLIIMDVKMPGMDGIEATRRIKQQNSNIPIIMQTAFDIAEVRTKAFEAGCDDFIVKPVSLNDFLLYAGKYLFRNV